MNVPPAEKYGTYTNSNKSSLNKELIFYAEALKSLNYAVVYKKKKNTDYSIILMKRFCCGKLFPLVSHCT
jgi:hypothetical protein